ncbi:SRPBCC family protein [Duganella aceris]|uniref:SRPBCC family protein n=1 Tax=Duganella aceris TaxID=2703883 RepID=A0ABX0FM45_9BURK|nr:SRPBCC family protein [Duganella aceris]NGZ85626.1 SRPBCC family protein [Duganella aceris]
MLKKISLAVVVLILIVVALAAMQPDSFRVQRAIAIKAPPEKIMPLISDFHQWPQWSPWEKLDPAMNRVFSGAPKDVGAVYAWNGNKEVGAGRMEITSMTPPNQVGIKLVFLEPFESHCVTDFALDSKGESTTVTWTMSGPSNFMTKVMGLFSSMDKMIGKDFEAGLASMKAAAEK